jgi:tetratricopeptide (TPR) repeat protein
VGQELLVLGALADARQLLEQAVEHQKEAVKKNPIEPAYRRYLHSHYWNLAETLVRQGNHSAAAKAAAALPRLKPEGWQEYRRAADYFVQCLSLAARDNDLDKEQYRRVEKEYLDRARELVRQAVRRADDKPETQSLLGAVLNNLAQEVRNRGELAEARQLLEQAVVHQRAALKEKPDHPTYRRFLCNHYANLAETLLRQGDYEGAAKYAAKLPDLSPGGRQYHYQAGNFLARCIPLAVKDDKLTKKRRAELVQTYGDRAVDGLRQAVQRGFGDLRHLQQDSAYDALRSRDDFKRLLAELQKKAKPKDN